MNQRFLCPTLLALLYPLVVGAQVADKKPNAKKLDIVAAVTYSDNIADLASGLERPDTMTDAGFRFEYNRDRGRATADIAADLKYRSYLHKSYQDEFLGGLAGLRGSGWLLPSNPSRGGGCRWLLLRCSDEAMNATPKVVSSNTWQAGRPPPGWRCWMLLGTLCWWWCAASPAAYAEGLEGRFDVRSADLELKDGVYHLNARLDLPVNDAVRRGLAEGVPLTIELDLDIERVRQLLPNSRVAELTQRYHLQYNAVSARYILRNDNSGQQESTGTIEAALDQLAEVRSLPVLDRSLIAPDRRYEANVRAKVDYGAVPFSLRVLMFWVNEWHRESDWYTWTLQP